MNKEVDTSTCEQVKALRCLDLEVKALTLELVAAKPVCDKGTIVMTDEMENSILGLTTQGFGPQGIVSTRPQTRV